MQHFRAFRDAAGLIASSGDLDLTLKQLVQTACQGPPWAMSSVMSVDPKNGYAHVITRHDPSLLGNVRQDRWSLATSPALVALGRNEPVIIADAFLAREFPGYRKEATELGYHTVVVLPMGCTDAEGRSMVLSVVSRDVVPVGEEELAFLGSLVHLGTIAVEKSHRLRADRLRTERLQTALSVQSTLLSHVLSDGSVSSATAMIGELFPNPVVAVDFSASLVVAGRTPRPGLFDDRAWQAAVRSSFHSQLMQAARRGIASSDRVDEILLDDGGERLRLAVRIEPLDVDGDAVGALIVFPRSDTLEELDRLLLESAKFALSVQMMRSYIRFQSDSRTLADLCKELFAGNWRDADDMAARARRLGIDPSSGARLIAVAVGRDAAGLDRSIARLVRQQQPDGTVVALGDTILCHLPLPRRAKAERSESLVRDILDEATRLLGEEPILVELRLDGGLEKYPAAWEHCQRIAALARRFGRRGALTAEDFGPFALLLAAAGTGEVRSFVDGSIGALLRHDARRRTAYVETLSKYFDSGARLQACADAMGLHVTTLRYRLARLRELFGIELDTQEQRFSLELAIRLHASLGAGKTPARQPSAMRRASASDSVSIG